MDINNLLSEWPYDPAACVRKIRAQDGREVLQVRTLLGIEQYEMEGRPDGSHPYGEDSVLEYAERQLSEHIEEFGETEGFMIDDRLALELQQEGVLYYYRYLVCFQLGEYGAVLRDAQRNLRMFDLLKAFCLEPEIVHGSEQYRPYVMRMLAAARLRAIGDSEYGSARSIIRNAIRAINSLPPVPTDTFEHEKKRSLAILRGMMKALPNMHSLTEEEQLRRELKKAVAQEDYERAAAIRDRIRSLPPSHHEASFGSEAPPHESQS